RKIAHSQGDPPHAGGAPRSADGIAGAGERGPRARRGPRPRGRAAPDAGARARALRADRAGLSAGTVAPRHQRDPRGRRTGRAGRRRTAGRRRARRAAGVDRSRAHAHALGRAAPRHPVDAGRFAPAAHARDRRTPARRVPRPDVSHRAALDVRAGVGAGRAAAAGGDRRVPPARWRSAPPPRRATPPARVTVKGGIISTSPDAPTVQLELTVALRVEYGPPQPGWLNGI